MILQLRRYFLARHINTYHQKLSIIHLEQLNVESIGSGLEVNLTIDANKHMVKGKLSQKVRN